MNSRTDQELLEEYSTRCSEAAFAELVRRHVDLVYSAALRMVCDAHLAEDVTQGAFVALAQSATGLSDRAVLSGWLHRTAQNLAANVVRTDVRRRAREQEAAAMNELLSADADASWENIAPHLDAALGELAETDRDALLLRYFEKKSAAEMATLLGISDEAAQKRVSRAVERLRDLLTKRGATVGASGLVILISTHAVLVAPAGLSAAIAAATVGALTTAAVTQATVVTMNWINAKSAAALVAAALMAGTGTYFVQERRVTDGEARARQMLEQQNQLALARDEALAAARTNTQDAERARQDASDLARLRNEVTQLRQQLAARKTPTPPPVSLPREAPQAVAHPPGSYIPKEQMAHVGFATPEAAIETITFVMMSGTYDQVNEAAGNEVADEELKNPKAREEFTERQKKIAPLFQGMQIVAKKILADDKVQLKVKQTYDPGILELNPNREMPEFFIQPMVKVGSEWRLGGSTRDHKEDWETTGQIQTFTP